MAAPSLKLGWVSAASALLAAGVAISYVYVDLEMNRMGASATAIGVNAAMPALGWLVATPLMPWALRTLPSKALLLGLLALAILSIACFPLFPHADAWLGLRFAFGGGTGMVFRLLEYWINVASPAHHRARNIGIYAMAFAAGAMAGGIVSPALGTDGWPPIAAIIALAVASGVIFIALAHGPPGIARTGAPLPRPPLAAACLPLFGILIYGMFEAVPYTLMPVYVVRHGLGDEWALWSAAAAIGGQMLLAVPTGLLADRFGKRRVATLSAACALLIPALIPPTMDSPVLLLGVMGLWGGLAGSLYNITLAMLADRFQGAQLAAANAAFGTLYAIGSLCGPPLHGVAMDAWPPHGLLLSASALFGLFVLVAAPARRRG